MNKPRRRPCSSVKRDGLKYLALTLTLVLAAAASAQLEGDVVINEIANSGTKKAMYSGGEYVELLVVKKEGVKLGGWLLTDLSSPSGTAKENEGNVEFSDKEGSIFQNTLPQGTYILVCLGPKDEQYGASVQYEDVSLSDANNRIVVFAYHSPQHIAPGEGTIQFTGKDNVVLLSAWSKGAAVSVVTWGGSSSWTGSTAVGLSLESLDNGKVVYFVPKGKAIADFLSTDPAAWESTSESGKATPGMTNVGADDQALQSK